MSAVVAPAPEAAHPPVVGAGTRRSLGQQLRASWPLLTVLGLVITLIVLSAVAGRTSDYSYLSTNNSTEQGARAVAQILRAQGVDVRQERTLAGARIMDPATTTVVIADPAALADYQIRSILDYPGPVVFLGSGAGIYRDFSASVGGIESAEWDTATSQCDHPDARIAETITALTRGVNPLDLAHTTACFEVATDTYAMLEETIDGRLLTVLASPDGFTNQHLADAGNAALALRLLGRQPHVVWYVGDSYDTTILTWADHHSGTNGTSQPPRTSSGLGPELFPSGTQDALFMLGLAALVLALVRGRRFGPLVPDPLPVIVPSSEAAKGRARLYRRGRSFGRATASLRAATAARVARRLGVPRYAQPAFFIDAVARASGHRREHVEDVFYGPPAASEADMHRIVSRLDQLESEVHRP